MLYKISGKVIHGNGYGKKLGFPTINLEFSNDIELPSDGIYSGFGVLGNEKYRAGIVVGPGQKLEAHLIGFSGDAYGRIARLELEKFLREYQKFSTEQELIDQIKKDISLC